MAKGDKILNWKSVYDSVNRVISLPPQGAATSFDSTTILDTNQVITQNTIDDSDLNNLVERFSSIKNDSLYGSQNQLNSTSHISTIVSLYPEDPDLVNSENLIFDKSNQEVQSVVYSLNRISCRNIVTCTKINSQYCSQQYTECNDCSNTRGCNDRDNTCGRSYSSYCTTNCNRYACNNSYYYATGSSCSNYYRYLACSGQTHVCPPRTSGGCPPRYAYACNAACNRYYVCGRSYYEDCGRKYNYTCNNSYYYCGSRSYYYYCSKNYYTAGCNQTYYVTCPDGTHNDILCSNTY